MQRLYELISSMGISESYASMAAKSLGLESDGFGRWKNKAGVVTHVTRGGRLVPVSDKPPSVWQKAIDGVIDYNEEGPGRGKGHVVVNAKNPAHMALAHAITLWTNGHVPAVRDTSKWEDTGDLNIVINSKIKSSESYDSRGRLIPGSAWTTSTKKKDYEDAHVVMKKLAAQDWVSNFYGDDLYRGLTLTAEDAEQLKEGSEFDVGTIASFTSRPDIVDGFNSLTLDEIEAGTHVSVTLVVRSDGIKRGAPIDYLAAFPAEKEVVTSGKVRVISINKDVAGHMTDYPKWEVEIEQL